MGNLDRAARDEAGATAIEYALIAGGVALAIIGVVVVIGGGVANIFQTVAAGFL